MILIHSDKKLHPKFYTFTKNPPPRPQVLNFSIAYGKTAHGLARDWGTDLDEAQRTVDRWYADRPEVSKTLACALVLDPGVCPLPGVPRGEQSPGVRPVPVLGPGVCPLPGTAPR